MFVDYWILQGLENLIDALSEIVRTQWLLDVGAQKLAKVLQRFRFASFLLLIRSRSCRGIKYHSYFVREKNWLKVKIINSNLHYLR